CHFHSKYESNDSYQAEIHRVVQARDVTLTVNTNLTRPLRPKSIKPFRLQSVPNNYTYIHTLEKHNPPSGAVGATNGCASRNKIGALGEVRFKTVALRGIPQ
ncbi:hypothetical protein SFRURICE_014000, partial [Spodoptera frugiperda]